MSFLLLSVLALVGVLWVLGSFAEKGERNRKEGNKLTKTLDGCNYEKALEFISARYQREAAVSEKKVLQFFPVSYFFSPVAFFPCFLFFFPPDLHSCDLRNRYSNGEEGF